ncbi:DUF411 domain-containing protein [Devosia sp. Naph2]|uniref:DUF411 domain-containing protein n=1 Tax=Devosia polycyclovorans TaxID=3345148 RepID=UPI0035CEDEF0
MKKTLTLATLGALAVAGAIAFTTFSIAQSEGDAVAPLAQQAASADAAKQITIWRDANCGCCDSYAEYLVAHGYQVTRVDDPGFATRSVAAGVPEQGIGCHLAEVDGYYVSGLVPVEIIERLVAERPAIQGITLPGMPPNAPGMAREKTGTLKTYAFNDGEVSVYSNE